MPRPSSIIFGERERLPAPSAAVQVVPRPTKPVSKGIKIRKKKKLSL